MNDKMVNEVLVSIKCMVYNHELFLRQCLDGFVMQKTNFRFEAIIHDDCSTDRSAEIIREYAEKYPEIIKPIFEKENQYSKGAGSVSKIMEPYLKGKFVAICEGDDYWTDPYKLQKQIDFLESHPNYVLCTHKCHLYLQEETKFGNEEPRRIYEDMDFDLDYFIKRENWLTLPLTTIYRKSAFNLDEYRKYKNSKDVALFYHLLKSGKGRYLNDCMAVYRVHQGGVWSGASISQQYFADMNTYIGIYEVEQDLTSARALKIWFETTGYFGPTFLRRYWRTYLKVLGILRRNFGFFTAMKLCLRSLNHFHSYFGY